MRSSNAQKDMRSLTFVKRLFLCHLKCVHNIGNDILPIINDIEGGPRRKCYDIGEKSYPTGTPLIVIWLYIGIAV